MSIRFVGIRPAFDSVLVLGGVGIVVAQVVAIADSRLQMGVVAVGIVMTYMGVWRLRSRQLRDRRVKLQLRSEVDHFIGLVRQLDAQATGGDRAQVDQTRFKLQESVSRIASFAGMADEQLLEGQLKPRAGSTPDHEMGSLSPRPAD